ncbi:hypothetical protein B0H14DRAFT_2657764 [Mycena olivaceomarginata]|nr:hypothetical protein B0H14DRAFT_2657764 [Mycena olivaceomarginata]
MVDSDLYLVAEHVMMATAASDAILASGINVRIEVFGVATTSDSIPPSREPSLLRDSTRLRIQIKSTRLDFESLKSGSLDVRSSSTRCSHFILDQSTLESEKEITE